jgi:hypothetical protein
MLTVEARLSELMRRCREDAHRPTYQDLQEVLGHATAGCTCGGGPGWCAGACMVACAPDGVNLPDGAKRDA